jgi:hypothetical protein
MYTLVRLIPWSRLLREQVPALALSFLLAEFFYKFHSFTLETLAFLTTWGVLDAVIQLGRQVIFADRTTAADGPRR